MTDEHKELLLQLYNIKGVYDYKGLSERLNVPTETIVLLYSKEYEEERKRITKIRTIWSTKGITIPFIDFYNWYLSHERRCHYCDITEAEIEKLLVNKKLETKRIETRGRKLELDRKEPNLVYDNFDNIVFACYWCNNAKTDTFTSEEFKEVGKVFKQIWKERMSSIEEK